MRVKVATVIHGPLVDLGLWVFSLFFRIAVMHQKMARNKHAGNGGKKILLCIFLATCATGQIQTKADLNLVVDEREVDVYTSSEPVHLNLLIKTGIPSDTTISQKVDVILEHTGKLANSTVVTKNPRKQRIKLALRQFQVGSETLKDMAKLYKVINRYKDGTAEDTGLFANCSLSIKHTAVEKQLEAISVHCSGLNEDIKYVGDKYTDAGGKPDDASLKAAVVAIADAGSIFVNMVNHVASKANERMDDLNELANGKVPASVLGKLDSVECVETAQQEQTVVNRCEKQMSGFYCELQITQNLHGTKMYTFMPLPLWYRGVLYELDVGVDEPVHEHGLGLVGSLEGCTNEGQKYICDNFQPAPNSCLEGAFAHDMPKILEHCKLLNKNPADPLVHKVVGGVLVAQRSDETVIVQVGREAITADPVLVENNAILKVTYGTTTQRFTAQDLAILTTVHTLGLNETVINLLVRKKYIDMEYLADWIPNEAEEVILLIVVFVVLALLIDACTDCFRRGNKYRKKRKSKKSARSVRYSRARRGIEEGEVDMGMEPNRSRRPGKKARTMAKAWP